MKKNCPTCVAPHILIVKVTNIKAMINIIVTLISEYCHVGYQVHGSDCRSDNHQAGCHLSCVGLLRSWTYDVLPFGDC